MLILFLRGINKQLTSDDIKAAIAVWQDLRTHAKKSNTWLSLSPLTSGITSQFKIRQCQASAAILFPKQCELNRVKCLCWVPISFSSQYLGQKRSHFLSFLPSLTCSLSLFQDGLPEIFPAVPVVFHYFTVGFFPLCSFPLCTGIQISTTQKLLIPHALLVHCLKVVAAFTSKKKHLFPIRLPRYTSSTGFIAISFFCQCHWWRCWMRLVPRLIPKDLQK